MHPKVGTIGGRSPLPHGGVAVLKSRYEDRYGLPMCVCACRQCFMPTIQSSAYAAGSLTARDRGKTIILRSWQVWKAQRPADLFII